jgi:hypothetical protein
VSACFSLPLAACIFGFQNCWSPFLAWANDRGRIEQGRKTKNNSPQAPTPPPRKKKPGPIMSACWAIPLAAWNFYFQNCSSPFLAYTNRQGQNFGDIVWKKTLTKLEESQVVNLRICYHLVYYGRILHVRVRGITSRH